MRAITAAVCKAGIQMFIVARHRWEVGDYDGWDHPSPSQIASGKRRFFAKGSWGGEWHPDFAPREGDIIIKEHWGQSGFANRQEGLTSEEVSIRLVKFCYASF